LRIASAMEITPIAMKARFRIEL